MLKLEEIFSNVKNIRFLLNCHNCLTNNLIEIKLAIHLELTIF